MQNELIEKIFNSKKVPYSQLLTILKPYISVYNFQEYSNVNIFIDVFNIMKQIYNPQTIESINSLKNSERRIIASHLINMISHYRHFFASRLQMYTTFYFFYSTREATKLKNINSNYRSTFYDKRLNTDNPVFGILNEIVKENFKLAKTFIEYVPHAYFIDSKDLEPNAIPYNIISRKNNSELSIIISNDSIFYQDLLDDNTIQLELRSDKTRIVTSENMFEILLEKTKKDISSYSLLPDCITILQALSSFKDYDIKGVKNMGYARAFDFVQKALDNNLISNIEYSSPDTLANSLSSLLNDEEKLILKNNMSLINHNYLNICNNYTDVINCQLTERKDAEGVKKVNNTYFEKFPILLDFCFEGEEY